eukprot:jgi/Bigna1/66066/fgenesh1_pg.1_\
MTKSRYFGFTLSGLVPIESDPQDYWCRWRDYRRSMEGNNFFYVDRLKPRHNDHHLVGDMILQNLAAKRQAARAQMMRNKKKAREWGTDNPLTTKKGVGKNSSCGGGADECRTVVEFEMEDDRRERMRTILRQMRSAPFVPTIGDVEELLSYLLGSKQMRTAMRCIRDIVHVNLLHVHGITPDWTQMIEPSLGRLMIDICARTGDLHTGLAIQCIAAAQKIGPSQAFFEALVRFHSKFYRLHHALSLLTRMRQYGFRPSKALSAYVLTRCAQSAERACMRVSHSFPSKSGASDGNEKTGGESVGTYCDGESASACVGVNTKYFSTLNADTLQAVKQLFINRCGIKRGQCKKLEEATAVRNTILPQFLRELTVAPPKPAGPLEYVSSPDTPNNERRSARSSCNDEKDQEQKTTANDMVLCAALRLYILSGSNSSDSVVVIVACKRATGGRGHLPALQIKNEPEHSAARKSTPCLRYIKKRAFYRSLCRAKTAIAAAAVDSAAAAMKPRMELEADPSSLFLNGDSLEFAETLFQHANNLTLPPAACQPGGTTMARGAATEAGDDPIVIIPYKSRLEEEEEKNGIGEEDGLASNDGYGKEKFVEEFKKEVKEDEKAREQDVWGKLSNKERRRHLWAAASYAEIKIQSGDMDAAMSVARMYPNSKWLYGSTP